MGSKHLSELHSAYRLVFTAAVILNLIGYLTNHKYVTLTSAILYGIALILLPTWGYLAIPSLALQIIAFVKIPGKNAPSP